MRYAQLNELIARHRPKTIIEVGTWNGDRAIQMMAEALKHNDCTYYGYDLFEQATPETDAAESNVKTHHSVMEVMDKLAAWKEQNGGQFHLIGGDTNETLKPWEFTDEDRPVLAFIDGGHSLATIEHDFDCLKDADIVALDDWYEADETGACMDVNRWGCNKVMEGHDFTILPAADRVTGGGLVKMVVWPAETYPGRTKMVVKTKNCVPEDQIQANIRYFMTRVQGEAVECDRHDGTAVMVSAGPDFENHIDEIRKLSRRKNHYLVCVKHSHDALIEKGIIPWACVLLDPRSHVQDFIENPHPNVTYFVSSMVHPTTVDRLVEKGARIVPYHALVGAGEDAIIKEMGGRIMISGGSTSATRGVAVLNALGFRKFVMYGYDSCYQEPQDETVKTKTGEQKYRKIEVLGREFWTDLELIAQFQDFQGMVQTAPEIDFDVRGDGLIPHFMNSRETKPSFKDLYG